MNLLLTLTTYKIGLSVALPFTVALLGILSYIPSIKLSTKKALQFCRWIIFSLAIRNLLFFLEAYASGSSMESYFGEYGKYYLFMTICSCILPLFLFQKWIGRKTILIFLFSLLLKIGMHLENFTIILTSYLRNSNDVNLFEVLLSFYYAYSSDLLNGIIFAIILMGIAAFFTPKASTESPLDSELD